MMYASCSRCISRKVDGKRFKDALLLSLDFVSLLKCLLLFSCVGGDKIVL